MKPCSPKAKRRSDGDARLKRFKNDVRSLPLSLVSFISRGFPGEEGDFSKIKIKRRRKFCQFTPSKLSDTTFSYGRERFLWVKSIRVNRCPVVPVPTRFPKRTVKEKSCKDSSVSLKIVDTKGEMFTLLPSKTRPPSDVRFTWTKGVSQTKYDVHAKGP